MGFLFLPVPELAISASLPKSTLELIEKAKIAPTVLEGIDKELEVPKDWLEKAKKEGRVRVRGTPGVARIEKSIFAPFRERYPFITLEFSGTNQEDRAVKTLVAYRSGRIIGDVVHSVSAALVMYIEAKAAEDLRSIPNWRNVPEGVKDPDGLWIAPTQSYWCMGYNTKLVKKEDLPKKWEDLLVNPQWRGGRLAIANRPTQWALQLWKTKGEKWTKDFLTKFFTEVKPQFRKEGTSTVPELLAAGEFHAVIPVSHDEIHERALKGAPVSFTCPEFVPAPVSETVMLKGTPNLHAARIYLNWILSKEGQLTAYLVRYATPTHKDLQRKEFVPFAEEILGKERVVTDARFEQEVLPSLNDFWNRLWLRGEGR